MKLLVAVSSVLLLSVSLVACSSSSSSDSAPTPSLSENETAVAELIPVAPYIRVATGKDGKSLLTDWNGMTLYLLKGDAPMFTGNACSDSCLSSWQPLIIGAGLYVTPTAGLKGEVGAFRRSDMPSTARQLLYEGKPLYRYSGDRAPGDERGAGMDGGKWSVARP